MDINNLLQEIRKAAPYMAESYCIVNGSIMNLNEVQNMGYDEFNLRAKQKMPLKLYKYFPNTLTDLTDKNTGKPIIDQVTGKVKTVNYSMQALKNNTVFMQSPTLFDDIYDSDINLDYSEYEKARLLEYCRRCEIAVTEKMETQELGNRLINEILKLFQSKRNFDSLFKRAPATESENLSNQCFLLKLKKELNRNNDLAMALKNVILSDFEIYSKYLQNVFRATCFATTPYSQLMWGGSYANCHKGFCVEYTVLSNDPSYQKLFLNLFPMVYCKVRPNMTDRLVKLEDKEPTKELLWDIYFHGALRKSIDWAFQDEWRLLLPMKNNLESKDYCVPFFPITKVFLGSRMPQVARKEIIQICHEKHIPYIGVTRKSNVFEMQECIVKCEDCPKYIENTENN